MGIERKTGEGMPSPEPREPAEPSKERVPPTAMVHGEAKRELVRDLEARAASKFDEWAACATRAELMGQPFDPKECLAKAEETVSELIRLMEMEDPNGVGEALAKAGKAMAKEYRAELNDPASPIKTLADVAADHLAEKRARALDERRQIKFAGATAFADLKRLIAKDLEALSGVPLSQKPSLAKLRAPEAPGAGIERERKERVAKAVEFLANNDYVLERYRQTRGQTLGHGIDESQHARREFVRELVEDMIPENAYDENVHELNVALQKGVKDLVERGGSPEERQAWRDLLTDATAEELRLEIVKTRPGLKGGGQAGPDAVKRVIEGLLRDTGDPAALKRKRKRPWEKE